MLEDLIKFVSRWQKITPSELPLHRAVRKRQHLGPTRSRTEDFDETTKVNRFWPLKVLAFPRGYQKDRQRYSSVFRATAPLPLVSMWKKTSEKIESHFVDIG